MWICKECGSDSFVLENTLIYEVSIEENCCVKIEDISGENVEERLSCRECGNNTVNDHMSIMEIATWKSDVCCVCGEKAVAIVADSKIQYGEYYCREHAKEEIFLRLGTGKSYDVRLIKE